MLRPQAPSTAMTGIANQSGKNTSAIHWDIVKDIRRDGAVFVDDRPVLKNGEFLLA